ncbi:D-alanine--D-alanine ligase [Magnetococcales bacterium HHB-1]
MGGLSDEREVSLKSGQAVLDALLRQNYNAIKIDADRQLALTLQRESIDIAVVVLHGPLGEDGAVQGLLESMGIPYTGPGIAAAALLMDKILAKRLFKAESILTPEFHALNLQAGQEIEPHLTQLKEITLPAFVKPANSGSSVGIQKVTQPSAWKAAIENAVKAARCPGGEANILVEQGIEGIEIAAAVFDEQALPLVEIRPQADFYDYEAKYHSNQTQYLTPPPSLSSTQQKEIQQIALKACRLSGCRGLSRADFIVDQQQSAWLLEINTIPGMTETSLAPKAALAAGITFDALAEKILASASLTTCGVSKA